MLSQGLRRLTSSRLLPTPPLRPIKSSSTHQAFSTLVISNVYVSDHSKELINHLTSKVNPHTCVVSTFSDKDYNRSSICLSGSPDNVKESVLNLVQNALTKVDYSKHKGTHPAIGAVDHVNVHPLYPNDDLKTAAKIARQIGERMGGQMNIPVYLYGDAHPSKRNLATGRRQLGYFSSHIKSVLKDGKTVTIKPDFGPSKPLPSKGVAMVGSSPHVVNYNIPVTAKTILEAKPLADAIREAKGGLPGVQAMVLENENGIEIACNLLKIHQAGPSEVQKVLKEVCEREGLRMGDAYVIGYLPDQILEKTRKYVGS